MKAYREYLVREKAAAHSVLLRQARAVQDHAAHVIRVCESDDSPIINSLGELQSSATMMEAACGRYDQAKQALKEFDNFAASDLD